MEFTETANMNNILVTDTDNDHCAAGALCNAVREIIGTDGDINTCCLFSEQFIDSLFDLSESDGYMDTESESQEDTESESQEDTNDPLSRPLTRDEMQSLINELKDKRMAAQSDGVVCIGKYSLKYLKISRHARNQTIFVLNDHSGVKEVHSLLSRLYRTEKNTFYTNPYGDVRVDQTSVNRLISEIETLMLAN